MTKVIRKAMGKYKHKGLMTSLLGTPPKRFRLLLKLGTLSKNRRAALAKAGFVNKTEIEIDVHAMLAMTPLRHVGTGYGRALAKQKELQGWCGWMGVHASGTNEGRLLVAGGSGNPGRQAEFSGSLGESVSLAVMTGLVGVPYAQISRIPENPKRKDMDFESPWLSGGIAVEGKSGHGPVVGKRKAEIKLQMRNRKAKEKLGVIVCYEREGRAQLKNAGSYVHVYDPPDHPGDGASALLAVLKHYLNISESIGFWALADGVRAHLEMDPRDQAWALKQTRRFLIALRDFEIKLDAKPGDIRRQRNAVGRYGPGFVVGLGPRTYLCRSFDLVAVANVPVVDGRHLPLPYFACGIELGVVKAIARYLLRPSRRAARALLKLTCGPDRELRNAFAFQRQGPFGPMAYTGLEDGTIRIDMVSMRQLEDAEFDVAEMPAGDLDD
jgi:hypothetical protein